jgi:ribulose-phosphate 3-epimerase
MIDRRVVPAILSNDEEGLAALLSLAASFAPYVQIDFMDGRFVPSVSAPPELLETIGLPVPAEAHLMVEHPERHFASLAEAKVLKVIPHLETLGDPSAARDAARDAGLLFGVAVNPGGDYRALGRIASGCDSVLFMTVTPGFYGSPFLPDVLADVRAFRREHPGVRIGVDGGAGEDNLLTIASAGADDICVGSAIFRASDPGAAFRRLSAALATATPHREDR